MPTPIGHALAGATIDRLLVRQNTSQTLVTFLTIILALLPDVDFLFGFFVGNPNRYHHQFTHSLTFVVVTGMIAATMLAGRNRVQFSLFAVVFMGAGVSHILLDFFAVDTREPFGIPLFWPLENHFYISPVQIFSDVHRASDNRLFFVSMLTKHNLWTVVFEIILLGPLLTIIDRLRKSKVTSNTTHS